MNGGVVVEDEASLLADGVHKITRAEQSVSNHRRRSLIRRGGRGGC
jgi:hypothetical protein